MPRFLLLIIALLLMSTGNAATLLVQNEDMDHGDFTALASAAGQIPPVPEPHPRLLFANPAMLERAEQWIQDTSFAPDADSPMELAFYGLLADDASACNQAVDLVLSDDYLLEPDLVERVASDLARWIGEAVIATYDWCRPQFSPQQAAALRERWNGYQLILNDKPWGGPGMEENNYFWGYTRNGIEWGLATAGENPAPGGDLGEHFLGVGYLDRFLGNFVEYDAAQGAGGVPAEGSQYGSYMLSYPVIPFLSLAEFGEDPYARTPFFLQSLFALLYSTTPALTLPPEELRASGQCPDRHFYLFPHKDDEFFHECDPAPMERGAWGSAMATYAHVWRDQPAGRWAASWLDLTDATVAPWLAAALERPQVLEFDALPLDYYAAGPGYLYARDSWSENATILALHLGAPQDAEGHHHLEAGSFQLWHDGRFLSRETTGYARSIRAYAGEGLVGVRETVAHNSFVFEGRGEMDNSALPQPAEVIHLNRGDQFVYAAVDLSALYRSIEAPREVIDRCRYDWPFAESLIREFLYLRDWGILIVLDRATASGDSQIFADECPGPDYGWGPYDGPVIAADEARKAQLFHFPVAPSVDGDGYVVEYEGAVMRIDPIFPDGASERLIDEAGDGGWSGGQHRLEIEGGDSAFQLFLTVLQLGPDRTRPNATQSGNNIEIAFNDGVTVQFNAGPVSEGGVITDNGVSTSLLPCIQGYFIDTAGPHWEDGCENTLFSDRFQAGLLRAE